MSAEAVGFLHDQIARGDFETAKKTADKLMKSTAVSFPEVLSVTRHAVNARQPEIALALLEGCRRFFASPEAGEVQGLIREMTALIAASWREKMDDPARKAVEFVLQMMEAQRYKADRETIQALAAFSGMSGRLALLRKDVPWFCDIAVQSAGWLAQCGNGSAGEDFLPLFDSWLHRILRQGRTDALTGIFDSLFLVFSAESDKKTFMEGILRDWRAAAGIACMNPEGIMAPQLVEHLLLFVFRTGDLELWRPVIFRIGEVATLAVSRHGIRESFSTFRPLLDVGRVALSDELKMSGGPDSDNQRQLIIRLVCDQALRIADLAAHSDFSAVTADKLEEIYRKWVDDPEYESHTKSIRRFCQLLLMYWAHNRKRAAKKWSPREKDLSEPLLLTDADRSKLVFLL